MNKHAYMIAANANFRILEVCLQLLDDIRNDIYIIFDKKSQVSAAYKNALKGMLQNSRILFCNDIVINWGGYSQIVAVLSLMSEVQLSGEQYTYIHFFQGSDLPIKPQNEIHHYFETHIGTQYVNVERERGRMANNKCCYFHFFCHNRFFRKNKMMKVLNFGFVEIQKLFGIQTNQDIPLYQGSALFSITYDCMQYLLLRKDEIRRRFRFALAADEVFVQSILLDSPYRNQIHNIDTKSSCNARLIDRTRPDGKNSPHIWRAEELDFILNQPEEICFARKFDEKTDYQIVTQLAEKLLGMKLCS